MSASRAHEAPAVEAHHDEAGGLPGSAASRGLRRLSHLSAHIMAPASEGVAAQPVMAAAASLWDGLAQAPPDPILGVTVAFNNDPSPTKLNLGVGAYRTEEGKPLVLDVVRRAEQRLVADASRNKEYLPITGIPAFNKLAAQLMLGADSPAIRDGRVVTAQCLSGTGSLLVGAQFLAQHYGAPTVLLPEPTWGNHKKIFPMAGCKTKPYRYYDPATRGLDINGLLEDLEAAPDGAVVLLHACAHNPTGVDPTPEQWNAILDVVQRRRLLPFFDSAYQGFASGSLDDDAAPVRKFVAAGLELFLAQSFAKNMGLYGERTGALTLVCGNSTAAALANGQLALIIRALYSSPPIHGAAIAATVLADPELYRDWTVELRGMADRIKAMRQQLFDALQERNTPGDWTHILKQIGMFTFTGLSPDQVRFMTEKYHVYMTADGRISMAGLSSRTVPLLADAIHAAVARG